ncbi:MAG: DUF2085 domain-containing protein [Pleurocapsa minor GSE-CHR-MK-17-07R]|jgi:uncharacterized membrane protein|nr:DUF2085 domain-containing protein [Pleurocapsa minor GSE-CHR-MK 17-07R]
MTQTPQIAPQPPRPPRPFAVRVNKGLLWTTKHWLRIMIVVLGLYSTLPIITPVLMKIGLTGPARALYTFYAPFCHQFGFRSLWLFGPQATYPRAVAGMDTVPFEAVVVNEPEFLSSYDFYYRRSNGGAPPASVTEADLASTFTPWYQFASKDFVGSEAMGYKTTLCARDVAIYLAMFGGVMLYALPVVRRRLRPVPIWLYLILGIGPIGIDGVSQLLGYPPFNLWPPRETLPVFRLLTGALFGIMNIWLALPYLDDSMRETRNSIEVKLRRAGIPIP